MEQLAPVLSVLCAVVLRDLSFNHMSRLEGTALAGLAQLQSLNLGDNALTHLGEGAFSSLASLRTL